MVFYCSKHGIRESSSCPGCAEVSRRRTLGLNSCPVVVVDAMLPEVEENLDLPGSVPLDGVMSPSAALEAAVGIGLPGIGREVSLSPTLHSEVTIGRGTVERSPRGGAVTAAETSPSLRRPRNPSLASGHRPGEVGVSAMRTGTIGRGRGVLVSHPLIPQYPIGRGTFLRPPPGFDMASVDMSFSPVQSGLWRTTNGWGLGTADPSNLGGVRTRFFRPRSGGGTLMDGQDTPAWVKPMTDGKILFYY